MINLVCTARGVDFDLHAADGTTLAVVGPNGAGKSTALQLVAGLLRPDSGGPQGRFVPPHQRDVGMLTQRALLFPHLSVVENVAFGPRAHGASRRDAERRAMAELDAVGLGDLVARRPTELSGGQAQRVALARALANDPGVLLLDEPLAALDVEAAQAMRTLLADRLRGRTVILVTHDALDLWTLADQIALVEDGRARVVGTVAEAAANPPSQFLAGLLGLNRVHQDGESILFEPNAVVLYPAGTTETGSARLHWPIVVDAVEPRGAVVRVRGHLSDGQALAADITARSAGELGIRPGSGLVAAVKATQTLQQ